jgi:hypothetical protein
VEFVKAVALVPQTSLWKKGELVKGSQTMIAGTAIATFNEQGKYPNHGTGNHAAIYLSQDALGIFVVEQYKGLDSVQKRHIRFRAGSGSPSNDGDAFSAIE